MEAFSKAGRILGEAPLRLVEAVHLEGVVEAVDIMPLSRAAEEEGDSQAAALIELAEGAFLEVATGVAAEEGAGVEAEVEELEPQEEVVRFGAAQHANNSMKLHMEVCSPRGGCW
jgi:hypothetical protein